jgi:predicted anti-sigma-YlaC factor YlaD
MNCKKAQQLFDDLAHERLAPETAAQVRRHLGDCTDCRVLEQRAARLQRLLALKRYERPSTGYFDDFLSEFHSRLSAETQRLGWWERMLWRMEDLVAAKSVRVWRYSFASAVVVAVVVGLTWMGVRPTGDTAGGASQTASANSSMVVAESALPAPHSTPSTIAAPVPGLSQVTPADYQPATVGSVVLVSDLTRSDSPAPRYVLDRISVTPADYDVPNVHF